MLVHGIAFDENSLQRARKCIVDAGVAGQAMVECLPQKQLPYLNDLANVVIVDDQATLAGTGEDELLRVLAPGGTLITLGAGGWTSKVKSRPAGMDEWTHQLHGADGNIVSNDTVLSWPVGVRWIDGVPVAVGNVGGTRALVTGGGRCFIVTANVNENVDKSTGLGRAHSPAHREYIVARDAFNGALLWKVETGHIYDSQNIGWQQTCPLVTDGSRVYSYQGNSIVAFDGATGDIVWKIEAKFPVVRQLSLLDDVLVASTWDSIEPRTEKEKIWMWKPKGNGGTLEAFKGENGQRIWSIPLQVEQVRINAGIVYASTVSDLPEAPRSLVALDLKSGTEICRTAKEAFGSSANWELVSSGPGYAVVLNSKHEKAYVVSGKDGSIRLSAPEPGNWTPIFEGLIWMAGKKFDPLNGTEKGKLATWMPRHACHTVKMTPKYIISNTMFMDMSMPGRKMRDEAKVYEGIRTPCVEGMVVANGMLYAAQSNCKCQPSSIYGMVAVGPTSIPDEAEYQKARPVEKGPAFGAKKFEISTEDWPLFRSNASRSACSSTQINPEVRELWRAQFSIDESPLAYAWQARLRAPITAPVCAGGLLFAARSDLGQVIALDAATGAPKWTYQAGSRIDSPPSIDAGLCIFGCNDGWIYALDAAAGTLAWRTRLAPVERRVPVCGQMESVWPAVGSVLVDKGIVYAMAGRSTGSDGSIALAAIRATDGTTFWAQAAPAELHQLPDVMAMQEGQLIWYYAKLDPATGKLLAPADFSKVRGKAGPSYATTRGPMLDGTWTLGWNKRSQNGFKIDDVMANLMAWNDRILVTHKSAISRETKKNVWQLAAAREEQIEAVAMTDAVVICAGRVKPRDKQMPQSYFLRFVSLADGKVLKKISLEAPPAYDGLVLARGKIYLQLQNGTLLCFGN
jgi:outer membrane protein assembly factor BamB